METVRRHGDDLVAGGAVIYDAKETLPDELKRSDVLFVPVPLTELAKEIGGRDIMRNTLALGVVAGLLDFDVSYVESIVRDNFGKKGQAVVDGNLRLIAAAWKPAALSCGLSFPPACGGRGSPAAGAQRDASFCDGCIGGRLSLRLRLPDDPRLRRAGLVRAARREVWRGRQARRG
jgi:hypothetical protein